MPALTNAPAAQRPSRKRSLVSYRVDDLEGDGTRTSTVTQNIDKHINEHQGLGWQCDMIGDSSESFYHPRLISYTFAFIWTTLAAFVVALSWWVPSYILGHAEDYKFDLIDEVVEESGVAAATFTYAFIAFLFSGVAAGIVYFVGDECGGSGLPPLISYISCGYLMNRKLMTLKTSIIKNIAMTCTVISGVSVGREGPAIQIGAAMAMSVGYYVREFIAWCERQYSWLDQPLKLLKVGDFKKPFSGEWDHELMLIGGACGFACAFDAPLGGMMFVYEEIAVHWTQHEELSSRIFFGVAVAIGFYHLFYRMVEKKYQISYESIVIYNTTTDSIDESWKYDDIPFFVIIGFTSGFLTGLMQLFSYHAYAWHKSLSREWRVVAAIGVAMLTAILMASGPAVFESCEKDPTPEELEEMTEERRFVRYHGCPDGYYNEMATLSLGSAEEMIGHLFARDQFNLSPGVLSFFLLIYAFTFSIQLGSAVPAGNFVPNVVMGALCGRIWGELALSANGCNLSDVCAQISRPGVYAVIGATCQLCAWTRTMPAMMVTMFEVTSDTSLVVPMLIMSTLSRSICNLFTTDGWAHCIMHAPFSNLPHHLVKPELWKDMDKMKPEEFVVHVHDHDHDHDDHGHDHHEKNQDHMPGHGNVTVNPVTSETMATHSL